MLEIIIDLPESQETSFTQDQEDGGVLTVSSFRRAAGFLENQTITIEFNNVNGFWSKIWNSEDKYLIGQTLKVLKDGRLVGTFLISKILEISTKFKLKADSFTDLSQEISRRLYKTDFPNLKDDGKYGNIIVGILEGEGGICTAIQVDTDLYHAAFHHLDEISAVYDKNGNPVPFTFNNSPDENCYINTSGSEEKELYFNARRMPAGSDNPGIILEVLNNQSAGYIINGLDEIKTRYDERYYTCSCLISKKTPWRQFLVDFGKEFDTAFFLDSAGGINCRVQDWEEVEEPVSVPFEYVASFAVEPNVNIIDTITRRFLYNFRQDSYKYTASTKTTTRWYSKDEEMDFLYNRSEVGTLDVTLRKLYRHSQPIENVRFALPYELQIDVYDVIQIKLPDVSIHPGETRTYLVTAYEHTKKKGTFIEGIDILSRKGITILLDDSDPQVALLEDDNDECFCLM